MEITKDKIEKLNQGNDLLSKWEMVKAIYDRASHDPILKEYFTEEDLKNAMPNIIICRTDEKYKEYYLSYLNKEERENIKPWDIPIAFTSVETNKVYIKPETPIDTIIHELTHAISNKKDKGTGIIEIGKSHYLKQGQLNTEKELQINSLNEAITHFITQILIPEIKVTDGYDYGSNIIEKYYEVCYNNGNKPDKILDSYFMGDVKSFESIIKDFDKDWEPILNSINMMTNIFLYKSATNNALNEEQVINVFLTMDERFKKANKENFNNYQTYSEKEQDMLSEIKSEEKINGKQR